MKIPRMPITGMASTVLLACALMSSAAPTAPATAHEVGSWTPTPALVAEVEAGLTLPEDSGPLDTYGRYYYGTFKHGRRLLEGEFVRGMAPGIHILVSPEDAPRILDGGCLVVNFVYDPGEKKVLSLFCNGVA